MVGLVTDVKLQTDRQKGRRTWFPHKVFCVYSIKNAKIRKQTGN